MYEFYRMKRIPPGKGDLGMGGMDFRSRVSKNKDDNVQILLSVR